MAKNLIFQSADKAKQNITNNVKKEIEKLYKDWAKDIEQRALYYQTKTTASSWLQEMNLRQLQAQVVQQSKEISNEVYGIARNSVYQVADAVVQANRQWLEQLGFPSDGIQRAFVSVPDQIVRNLVTGQIYESGWSLSKAIWSDNEKALKDIYSIIAGGVATNMPVYDIAKKLEQYVSPQKVKPWNPLLKMTNTKTGQTEYKRIYKRTVDYNAQRLTRTLIQHSYQQSFVSCTKENPFVIDYIWLANGSRVCPLCQDRDGHHYKKDELPLDHPNGMCTMEPNVDPNMIDKLAEWVSAEDGDFPEIDSFAKNFGYLPAIKLSILSNTTKG